MTRIISIIVDSMCSPSNLGKQTFFQVMNACKHITFFHGKQLQSVPESFSTKEVQDSHSLLEFPEIRTAVGSHRGDVEGTSCYMMN